MSVSPQKEMPKQLDVFDFTNAENTSSMVAFPTMTDIQIKQVKPQDKFSKIKLDYPKSKARQNMNGKNQKVMGKYQVNYQVSCLTRRTSMRN